jgi:hypothetical protein
VIDTVALSDEMLVPLASFAWTVSTCDAAPSAVIDALIGANDDVAALGGPVIWMDWLRTLPYQTSLAVTACDPGVPGFVSIPGVNVIATLPARPLEWSRMVRTALAPT